jgi:hypothetical protein
VLNRSLGTGALPEGVQLEGTLTQPRALTVPWSANTISFEFAVLHYAEPRRNAYTYWLEGFDKQPVQADASRPVATYTNLAPGKYHFHLQGTNNKGVAARDEIILPVTITPPPWQTGWARAAQALLVLSAAAVLARWLMRAGAHAPTNWKRCWPSAMRNCAKPSTSWPICRPMTG